MHVQGKEAKKGANRGPSTMVNIENRTCYPSGCTHPVSLKRTTAPIGCFYSSRPSFTHRTTRIFLNSACTSSSPWEKKWRWSWVRGDDYALDLVQGVEHTGRESGDG